MDSLSPPLKFSVRRGRVLKSGNEALNVVETAVENCNLAFILTLAFNGGRVISRVLDGG